MRLRVLSMGSILHFVDPFHRIVPETTELKSAKQIDFYDREGETLDRARLRSTQNERLGKLLRELVSNGFYREKLDRAGLNFDTIRTAEDLKRVPFTTKAELVAEQQTHPP